MLTDQDQGDVSIELSYLATEHGSDDDSSQFKGDNQYQDHGVL